MNITALEAIGLTNMQAKAYVELIEHGEVKPVDASKALKTTRTNAYKLFDRLVELGLATKQDSGSTLRYRITNPIALTSLTAKYRAEAVSKEEAANVLMHDLLGKYYQHSDQPAVEVATGNKEVAAMYRKQLNLREDVHFIHTKADVPMMGFDVMHDIRVTPGHHGLRRKGILTAPRGGLVNHANHKRGNLEATWIEDGHYTSPVEWSVTATSLLIVLYATEPHAILIVDKVVAAAFLQLWNLLNDLLQPRETHQRLRA